MILAIGKISENCLDYIHIYIVKHDFCNFVFRKKLPIMIAMAIAATIIEP